MGCNNMSDKKSKVEEILSVRFPWEDYIQELHEGVCLPAAEVVLIEKRMKKLGIVGTFHENVDMIMEMTQGMHEWTEEEKATFEKDNKGDYIYPEAPEIKRIGFPVYALVDGEEKRTWEYAYYTPKDRAYITRHFDTWLNVMNSNSKKMATRARAIKAHHRNSSNEVAREYIRLQDLLTKEDFYRFLESRKNYILASKLGKKVKEALIEDLCNTRGDNVARFISSDLLTVYNVALWYLGHLDGENEKVMELGKATMEHAKAVAATWVRDGFNVIDQDEVTAFQVDMTLGGEADKTHSFPVPTTPMASHIYQGMTSFSDLQRVNEKKDNKNRSATVSIKDSKKKNTRSLTIETKNSKSSITFSNMDNFPRPAKKLYWFALGKVLEQAFYNGKLTRNYIQYSLDELVGEDKMYKTKRTARRGSDEAADFMTGIKAKGEVRGLGKDTIEQKEIEVIFTGYKRDKGECVLYLNDRLNWGLIAAVFSHMPDCFLGLSNKAADLLVVIVERARQNTDKIVEKENGKQIIRFTIRNRYLQDRLSLPAEGKTKNPYRDIIQPIDEAIKEINKKDNNLNLKIHPRYNSMGNIMDFLENGAIEVELTESYSSTFLQMEDTKTKRIEKAVKKKEKIEERARAKALEKSISKELESDKQRDTDPSKN